MRSYILNTETMEFPIYEGDFRLNNPEYTNVEDLVPPNPYVWVYEEDQPPYDPFSERVIETTPKNINGVWKRAWSIVPLSNEELLIAQKRKLDFELKRKGVPIKLQMRQLRLQLNSIGKYDTILQSIQTASDSLKIEWEYATEVPRYSELMNYIQETLKMTDEQTNEFYINASKL